MEIKISKTDYAALLSLIGKAVTIIKTANPPPRQYNVARKLGNLAKKIERRNKSN